MKKINSSSILSILFLLGILIMINTIGIRYFIRADLTSSKMYSLSKASKNIVENIEDKLLIKAYFSPDLPGQYGGVERYLRDMLEDYRAFSHGHLNYEFIDPGSEKALEEEAASFKIPAMQVQSVEDDKIEVKKVYMGVVFIYGDKQETIPTITGIGNLEYEITSLIHRLTTPKQQILGIASTGAEDQRATMQRLYEALGRIYDVRPVSFDEPIEDTFDGIFVLAPRLPFTDWQLFNLDQYIINGGKVGMFMNWNAVNLQNWQAMPINLNINDFLNNYGLGLGEDLLIDARASIINIQESRGFLTFSQPIRFHYLPTIQTFNRESVITRDIQSVQTFFPSSVDTTLAKEKGFEVQGLMYTSELSGRKSGPYIMMNPKQPMTQNDFNEKYIPIAATVKGKFTSYFAETGPPKKPVENADAEGEVKEEEYIGPFVTEAEEENRFLLVGDGYMTIDDFSKNVRDMLFVQNSADWLLQTEDLISIRSKQLPMIPLKEVPDVLRNLIKWANRLGPIILVIILGIALWQIRRIRNKALMISQ